jgi:hypothetical protein
MLILETSFGCEPNKKTTFSPNKETIWGKTVFFLLEWKHNREK